MLAVQEYLRSGRTLEQLESDHGVTACRSEHFPLVILNYSMFNSDKRSQITRECRGLVLEVGDWKIVGRSFPRFFNAGECPDLERKFNWGDFVAESKEDGSLILLFRYRGQWIATTRGSFAQGEISPGSGLSWEEVFYSTLDEVELDDLDNSYTYVFELCSPYNKIVKRYPEPVSYLLSAFHTKSGFERGEYPLDREARRLGVQRPSRLCFSCLDEIVAHLDSLDDATFEGFVLRDCNGMRLKVKSKRYVALHHVFANGNLFNVKNLLPIVLEGEQGEVLTSFPEVSSRLFDVVEELGGAQARMMAVWEQAKGIQSQKEFAKYVMQHTQLASILFLARKKGVHPNEVFRKSADILLRYLKQ